MHRIEIEKIVVAEDRIRKAFNTDALEDLIQGILSKGLFHPLVLREVEGRLHLMSGERRLRAIREIYEREQLFNYDGSPVPPGEVPYVLSSELSPTDFLEAELEENILREDLTWQERTQAIARLHELRVGQNPEHTQKATAEEIARKSDKAVSAERRNVSHSIVVAEHLDDPEIAKARDLRDALNRVSRKLEGKFAAALAAREAQEQIAHSNSPFTLIHGNLLEELPKLEAGRYNLTIADPPYGIGADEFGDAAKLGHEYDDTKEVALELSAFIFAESYRVSADEAALFCFCDIELFVELRTLCGKAGWRTFRTPIIWNKYAGGGHMPWQAEGFRRRHEIMLFAKKGSRPLRKAEDDVMTYPPPKELQWAAQKSDHLYKHLMALTMFPGEEVLDPCCGAGTVFSGVGLNRWKATGIELNKEAYGLSAAAIQDVFTERRRVGMED